MKKNLSGPYYKLCIAIVLLIILYAHSVAAACTRQKACNKTAKSCLTIKGHRDKKVCKVCKPTHYNPNGLCKKCVSQSGCKSNQSGRECTKQSGHTNRLNCKECKGGHRKNNNKFCVKCTPQDNCVQGQSDTKCSAQQGYTQKLQCKQCKRSYYVDSQKVCKKCTKQSTCKEGKTVAFCSPSPRYKSKLSCSECISGYYINQKENVCYACTKQSSCTTSGTACVTGEPDFQTKLKCQTCATGYKLDSNKVCKATSSYPCDSGDYVCFCDWKGVDGYYADVKANCANFYICINGIKAYQSCQNGLLFNNNAKVCDWPGNVNCDSAVNPPTPIPPLPPPGPPIPASAYYFAGYYQSWSGPWAMSAEQVPIAAMPNYVNVIIMSFMKPDATYTGGLTFEGTGLDVMAEKVTYYKDAITIVKQRNPYTRVLLAVGGATYYNWDSFQAQRIGNFVKTFGFDGVDIDFEPQSPTCTYDSSTGKISCSTDAKYESVVKAMRVELPKSSGYWITTATFSTGCYGEGAYRYSLPTGSIYTGVNINVLRNLGTNYLDAIMIMAYDAGNTFDPTEAFNACKSYYNGRIMLGVQVSPDAWPAVGAPNAKDPLGYTELRKYTNYVKNNGGHGMMLWSLQKPPGQTGALNAQEIAQDVCLGLEIGGCDQTYPGTRSY